MVTFFKSKPPTHKPKTGVATLTRQQFLNTMRTQPSYSRYSAEVGPPLAAVALDNMYDEQLRCVPLNGVWSYGTTTQNHDTVIRLADDAALKTFFSALGMFLDVELDKIKGRRHYIGLLKSQMTNGQLHQKLVNCFEPEANYFTVKPAPPARPGAAPVPVRSDDWAKASQWLVKGVQGSTQAYDGALAKHRSSSKWPLGKNDHMLRTVWQTLAPGAPAYRGWNNTATQQKYPSNVGGTKLLDEMLADLGASPPPSLGDSGWYDRALYFYGAAMTAQAFTDGNKRICRFGYAIILGAGGVPFIAPNGQYGASLADMM